MLFEVFQAQSHKAPEYEVFGLVDVQGMNIHKSVGFSSSFQSQSLLNVAKQRAAAC